MKIERYEDLSQHVKDAIAYQPAGLQGVPMPQLADEHVSFRFEAELIGGHVHVKVRASHRHPSVQADHARGLCGELVMAPEEWVVWRRAIDRLNDDPPILGLYLFNGRSKRIAPAPARYLTHGPTAQPGDDPWPVTRHDGQFIDVTEEGFGG